MVAVAFEFRNGEAIVVMGHMISPVIPQGLYRHALWRVGWDIAQGQAMSVTCAQIGDSPGTFDGMDTCAIGHGNHAPFASRRAGQTFFDQAAEGLGVSFMGANADDVTGAPVRGGAFITFRWMHTRRADATLMTAKHPHARQSGKQTQFGFVLNIDIGATRRMVQKPCNCAFF